MRRIEIMANNSVQEDIIEGLESAIADFYYTLVPVVHGRGRQQYKLGTATWPEENFLLIAYIDDAHENVLRKVVDGVKKRFPNEGIKLFAISAE